MLQSRWNLWQLYTSDWKKLFSYTSNIYQHIENSCLLWQNGLVLVRLSETGQSSVILCQIWHERVVMLNSAISMKHTKKANYLAIPHWRMRVFRAKTRIVNWGVIKRQTICKSVEGGELKSLEARTGMKKILQI